MNMENNGMNTCKDGSCEGCAVGMCGGRCGCGHHHNPIKLLVKVILLIFVTCIAFKMGEVKGLLENAHMYREYGGMMSERGSGWNIQPMMGGTVSNTTPTTTTTTPAK
jgi:hypothetical protein